MSRSPQLPLRAFYGLHDTALDLHRSRSLLQAVEKLSCFCIDEGIADHLTAVVTSPESARPVTVFDSAEDSGTPPNSRSQPDDRGHQAVFDIVLPTRQALRLAFLLPSTTSFRDQVTIEVLCEHLEIAGKHLPFSFEAHSLSGGPEASPGFPV